MDKEPMKTLEDLKKELFRDKPGLEQKYLERKLDYDLISECFEFEGDFYIPFKKICEDLGLSHQGQLRRIKRNFRFIDGFKLISKYSNGGIQKTICLKTSLINNFIESLCLNKIEVIAKNQDKFIYLIDYGCNYYKIGLAQDLRKRFVNLNGGSPYDLKLIDSFKTTNSLSVEKTLHKMFKKNLVKGKKEFFMFDKKTLEEVKNVFRLYGSEV
jgi:hypothetical protein